MREIKFRAWHGNQMVSMPLGDFFGLSRFFGFLKNGDILMQWTGLFDKNGKEIYENDIVDWNGDKFKIITYCATAWIQSDTKQLPVYEIDMTELEILGNVHQNPELLAGKTIIE